MSCWFTCYSYTQWNHKNKGMLEKKNTYAEHRIPWVGGDVTVAGVSRLGDELEFSHTIATTQGECFSQ